MNTFLKTKAGVGYVIASDNTEEETYHVVSLEKCDYYGRYDCEVVSTRVISYSEVEVVDTNRSLIGV